MSSVAVISAVGVGVGAYQQNKAMKQAKAAGQSSQVDIEQLDALTRNMARRNAFESAALERELTPEVPQLRQAANQAVLSDVGTTNIDEYNRILLSQMAEGGGVGGPQTPLLKAAIAKAKADLALGGKLDKETQNQVTRAALSKAGTVAPGGLRLGRDLTARDLGLTSMQVEQQRLQAAGQLGGQELNAENLRTETDFNNRSSILNAVNLLNAAQNSKFGRNLAAAQFGESIRQPVVGLDPSSVANITTGNATNMGAAQSNQANIYGQQGQNYMNMAGQLAGYGLLAYNSRKTGSGNTGPGFGTSQAYDTGLSYV